MAAGAVTLAAPGITSLVTGPKGVETNVVRDKSIWTTQAPPLPRFSQITGRLEADLLVIGGGYTGLSCPYYTKIKRPDWRVIVIDSHGIGSGASSRNTGAVYAKQQGINDQGFADRGLSRLFTFIEQQEIECDLTPAPTLMLFTSKSAATHAKSNLSPDETWHTGKALNKQIGSSYYAGAIATSKFYKIQPAKLIAGHVKAAMSVGVELYENSPALEINHGKVAAVITPDGQINAKQVMLATNAYTPRLGIKNYKMFPVHQYSLATRKLNDDEVKHLGLDRWTMRFEQGLSSVTFSLTPTGIFFYAWYWVMPTIIPKSGKTALAEKSWRKKYSNNATQAFVI